MSYEARIEAAEKSSYGIRISYPKLKALYKMHGVNKTEYEEPDTERGKRTRTKK